MAGVSSVLPDPKLSIHVEDLGCGLVNTYTLGLNLGLCDSRLGLVNYNIRVSGLELMGLGLRVLVLIF